jgi:quinoprotein dehydrogenase-associated probable ABC transporter substrate-binding protein
LALAALAAPTLAQDNPPAADKAFRVCADPNNLPFSNEAGEGFENKLAELIADTLGEKVTYTWHAQRRGFVRETLKANECDVVMGMPTQVDMLATTQPYYRSSYVFVSRADRHLDISSIKDPRLKGLKIGVQLIGNDGANTPPSHALARQGLIDNLVGYTVYGDYRTPNPPARIVQAVEKGDVDIAAVWGPLAGYFAKHSPVSLVVTPITDTEEFKPLIFRYDIALGVRKGDQALKAKLENILTEKRPDIVALLRDFGIPTLPMPTQASDRQAVRTK